VISFNEGSDAARGGIFWWPRMPTLANYQEVFKNRSLMPAFGVSILRTVIGTYVSVLFTGMIAYALAHQRLMFRRFCTTVLMISLCFSGGVVPYYVLLKWIGLYDTLWVYIVPSLMGVVNCILMMNFFGQIPASLEESARMDGAGYMRIFFKIILPVSTPVVAAIALFVAAHHWNDWFSTGYFTKTRELRTAAYQLKEMINRETLSY
jgi:putative aldouronate transport system permease protein